MGEALTKVGQVGLEVADRIQKAQTDQELVRAEIDARTRLDRLKRDLEADAETPEVALPDRWRQESEAILKDASGKIGSERARTLWMDRAKGWQGEGENWSVDLSRKRSVEKLRAEDIGLMTTLGNEAGDLTIGADTYAKKLEALNASIESKRAAGFYAADDAARYRADVAALGMKDRTIRFTSNLDALIKDGRVAEAEALYQAQMGMNKQGQSTVEPETLAKVKGALDQSKQEFAVVEQGDAIWAKSGGDYGKAVALTAEIKDAPLRLKVEARINQKAAQAKAAEDARQDTLEASMWEHVEKGGTIMNAPSLLRSEISPSRLGSIRAYESARDAATMMSAIQKAQWSNASKNWRDELQSASAMPATVFMSEPSKWSERDYAKYQALTPEDQNAIRAAQRDMRDKGQSYSEVSKIESQLIDLAKVVAGEDWGLNADYRSRPDKAKKLLGELRGQAARLAPESGGRPLSSDEVERAVALALRAAGETKSDFVSWQTFSMNVDPAFAANRMDTMEYDAAFNDLKTAGGQDPTFEEVQELLAIRRRAAQ